VLRKEHAMTSEYMITREVAELLRTSPETLRYWAWQGKGPRSFKAGRRRLYRRADVEAWVAEREREASRA
jgi:excisionase family DNA binding protein